MNDMQPLEQAGYREWGGNWRSPWRASLALVRVGLAIIFRRWVFWALIGLGLMNFLFNFAFIYLKATLVVQTPELERFLDNYRVTGTGEAYADFMNAQAAITTLLLAFAGSALVGSDYQRGGMVFYLSRAIDRRHYIVGKLLAIAAVVALITTVPALVLYVEYGLLSKSLAYFRENWRILGGILGFGLVLAVVQSFLLFAVAAWVPRTVPLVMTWLGLFVLLSALAHAMRRIADNRRWLLLALWEDMYHLGRWCFGSLPPNRVPSARETALVLVGVCVVCALLIVRRVRAVEVVK
uniref:ABC transporter permease n=1 Tax=Schlesneria paludicola TaxID=360056 RepID=A0A7C4QK84_9PLAN